MEKTYHASCHCGKVKVRARFDLADGTNKCNCSMCRKIRFWGVSIKPEAFTFLTGEDDLSDYLFNTRTTHNLFCTHCGVRVFVRGHNEEMGDFYNVNVACLDDVGIEELVNARVRYMDGLHDNWKRSPAEARHL